MASHLLWHVTQWTRRKEPRRDTFPIPWFSRYTGHTQQPIQNTVVFSPSSTATHCAGEELLRSDQRSRCDLACIFSNKVAPLSARSSHARLGGEIPVAHTVETLHSKCCVLLEEATSIQWLLCTQHLLFSTIYLFFCHECRCFDLVINYISGGEHHKGHSVPKDQRVFFLRFLKLIQRYCTIESQDTEVHLLSRQRITQRHHPRLIQLFFSSAC